MSKKAVLDDPFNTPVPPKNWTPLIIVLVVVIGFPIVLMIGLGVLSYLVVTGRVDTGTTYEVDDFFYNVTNDMPAAYQMLDYGLKDHVTLEGFETVMAEFVGCSFEGRYVEFGNIGTGNQYDKYDDLKSNTGWLNCDGVRYDATFQFRVSGEGPFRFVDGLVGRDWANDRQLVYEMMEASGTFNWEPTRGGEAGYGFINIDERWLELRNVPGTIRWIAQLPNAGDATISLSRGDMYSGVSAFEVASNAAQSMAGSDWRVSGPDAALVGEYDGHLVVGYFQDWKRIYSYFVDDGEGGVITLTFEVSGNWGWDAGGTDRDSIESIVSTFRLEG